jgi:hypothetical protein
MNIGEEEENNLQDMNFTAQRNNYKILVNPNGEPCNLLKVIII